MLIQKYDLMPFDDTLRTEITNNKITINHDGTAEIKIFRNGILRFRDNEKKSRTKEPDEEENILRSIRRSRKKIQDYAYNNPFEYFITLTFARSEDGYYYLDGEAIDITKPKGVSKLLRSFYTTINRYCKRKGHDRMRYLFVLERHKSGHIHVHGLIYGIPDFYLSDSSKRDKRGSVIYNISGWNHGFSTAIKIYAEDQESKAKVSRYITKYMTKELETLFEKGEQRYYASKGLLKASHFYDLTQEFIDGLNIIDIYPNDYYKDNPDYDVYSVELSKETVSRLLTL